MQPARRPPARRDAVRLLAVDTTSGRVTDARPDDLPTLLRPGDLVVVNDAATLPSSLPARSPTGQPIEVRLVGAAAGDTWHAVVFGAGSWRDDTDARPAPEPIVVGDRIQLGDALTARVTWVSPLSPRLLAVQFDRDGAALWSALYAAGAPVQYSYLRDPLELWSVQTTYGARPWAAEMPSAGRPLSWSILLALRRAGVDLAAITHAAGLSATGDPALDRAMPLPERFEVPSATVDAVARARARGGRVIAVGTTVVRALEGNTALHAGELVASCGITELLLGPDFAPRIVDGVITGMHAPTESHYQLLRAFAPDAVLASSFHHAVARGYRGHELGDIALFAPAIASTGTSPRPASAPRAP